MVGRTIAFCRLSTCLVLSEVDRVEKPPSYVGPIDVGQVANLRGGWLPPPVRCECGSGPIDNRPQLAKLPHKVSLAGRGANQFFMKFRGPEPHPNRVEKLSWRTHSCVQRRISTRRLCALGSERRHECPAQRAPRHARVLAPHLPATVPTSFS